jgi:diguanylate cyclase (GGDEF)-like protein
LLSESLFLILAKNEANAYLSNQILRNELIIVLFLAAVLAWFAAILVSRSITRPLEELIKIARNISKGKYIDSFPSSGTREVETLSKAINNMQVGIVEREKAINKLAFFDELTNLPNRIQFNQVIEKHIQQNPTNQLIVLTMDVDRFKEINDTVGHEIGDTLLQLIAQRLTVYTDFNPFIARLSGDEFGIVFDIVDIVNIEKIDSIASNVVALFEPPFTINELVLDIDCSIGISVYPEDASTHQGLLQCADIAMYSCKEQHYRYAIYKPELNQYSVMRLNLMSELKGALKEGQLQLHYQPKLSLLENQIHTVECLIRWTHPEHGFVAPDEFIPLAEQTGAIRYVTNWALDTACRELQTWRNQGIQLGVAVNISAMDLVDMSLPTYIAELLTKYELSSDVLTLEVTESAVMSDPDSAFKALNILKDMGITLSIDDFGTGYSSMAQLKKMPVHELKIDKTFVLDLASNKGDQVMVKTLISLAKNLSLKTVAEGVEDKETLNLLSGYGCTKAQGFYMSKALPVEQFNVWYQEFNQKNSLGS